MLQYNRGGQHDYVREPHVLIKLYQEPNHLIIRYKSNKDSKQPINIKITKYEIISFLI